MEVKHICLETESSEAVYFTTPSSSPLFSPSLSQKRIALERQGQPQTMLGSARTAQKAFQCPAIQSSGNAPGWATFRTARRNKGSFIFHQTTATEENATLLWHSSHCPFVTTVLLSATLIINANSQQLDTLFLKDKKESTVCFSLSSAAVQGQSWARCLPRPALQDIAWLGTCAENEHLPKEQVSGTSWGEVK